MSQLNPETRKVCVVAGVGPGNGAAFARRFSSAGYFVVMLSRQTKLTESLAREIPHSLAFECDVTDQVSVAEVFDRIEQTAGPAQTLIYNAGKGVWGSVEAITPQDFEVSWRSNALGLLITSQRAVPAMKQSGHGNIIVVGATASRRGAPGTAAFAPAKAAQRTLAEAMAKQLWPAGVHVASIIIDGVVDEPVARSQMPDKPDQFFVHPADVAEMALSLARQMPSAWTFEMEARPFGEKW